MRSDPYGEGWQHLHQQTYAVDNLPTVSKKVCSLAIKTYEILPFIQGDDTPIESAALQTLFKEIEVLKIKAQFIPQTIWEKWVAKITYPTKKRDADILVLNHIEQELAKLKEKSDLKFT
jgi:hypothetical protein